MTDTPSAPAGDDLRQEANELALRANELYAEITHLRAELAEAKRERDALQLNIRAFDAAAALQGGVGIDMHAVIVECYKKTMAKLIECEKRAEQAEAARDRFAAVIAWVYSPIKTPEGAKDTIDDALAHHRIKQEKEQNRG